MLVASDSPPDLSQLSFPFCRLTPPKHLRDEAMQFLLECPIWPLLNRPTPLLQLSHTLLVVCPFVLLALSQGFRYPSRYPHCSLSL